MTDSPRDLQDDDLDQITGGAGNGVPTPAKSAADPGALDMDALVLEAMKQRGIVPPELAGKSAADLSKMNPSAAQGDINAFMSLFSKVAQEMRTTARDQRSSQLQSQVSALQGAASEIQQAAQQRMMGAVVSGAMQIAGSTSTLGVATGMKPGAGALGDTLQNLQKDMAQKPVDGGKSLGAEVLKGLDQKAASGTGEADYLTSIGQSAGGVMGGIGTIVQATQEGKAAEHDAKKAELEAQAKVQENGVQQANDLMQQMMGVIKDVRDKLASIDQSRIETAKGIARNI